jgi:ribose transport system ATP-binding protein
MAPVVRLTGISKHYGGVPALTDVDLDVAPGVVHAILGENGAGKSTLMKLLAGVTQPSAGRIEVDGRPVRFASPRDAAALGIVCMFQELSLVPDLTVGENIVLSQARTRAGFIRRSAWREAEAALARIGAAHIKLNVPVRALSLADRQLTEIAKALYRRPRLLILDEATSALTQSQTARVFAVVREAKAAGAAILFISHRFAEVDAVADRVSVFRNGQHVETFPAGTRSREAIVALMIGQRLTEFYPPRLTPPDTAAAPLLTARGLSWHGELRGVDLDLRPGEIVGLGGLDGQGQQLLVQALFGVLIGVQGEITVAGKQVHRLTPNAAKRAWPGFALVPEDRKTEGLILDLSIAENLQLAWLDQCRFGLLRDQGDIATRLVRRLGLVYGGMDDAVSTLSGGNQQKVVLAKWLALGPRCLLLLDPTRGIDVRAKSQIYSLLRELAAEGMAILLQSTDQEELVHVCDRVHIFYQGRVNAVLEGDTLTAEALVAACMNLLPGQAAA